jgi:L-xylulokinase
MGLGPAGGQGAAFLLGIDAGQTFTKAVLFTLDGMEAAVASTSIPALSPHPRWQERDMDLAWERTARAIQECIRSAGISPEQIRAVGLCGHNDGLYLVDGEGAPVRNAILATDARATEDAKRLAAGESGRKALAATGQIPAPYSPSALLSWLELNEPQVLSRARWLLFCKDWLRLQLTGEIATDPTEASASFTDLRSQRWSEEALEIYGLQDYARLLPPILDSAQTAGAVTARAAEITGLAVGTPVVAGAHDVDTAALGIGAADVGALSIVMGTFSINQIVSDQPVTDVRWQARTFLEPGQWLHMSTSPSSASNFEWAVRTMRAPGEGRPDYNQAVREARLTEKAAFNESPLFLPYLFGAPAGFGGTGGVLAGLRGDHSQGDLMRAVLEGIVYNHRWHVDALRERFTLTSAARLCGGGARNENWSQLMANALNVPIEITDAQEAGARGAALLAGIGVGLYKDKVEAVSAAVRVVRTHEPDPEWKSVLDERYAKYLRVAEATSLG